MVQPDFESRGKSSVSEQVISDQGASSRASNATPRRDLAVLEVQPVGDGHGEATVVCRSNHVSTSGPSTKTF